MAVLENTTQKGREEDENGIRAEAKVICSFDCSDKSFLAHHISWGLLTMYALFRVQGLFLLKVCLALYDFINVWYHISLWAQVTITKKGKSQLMLLHHSVWHGVVCSDSLVFQENQHKYLLLGYKKVVS